MAEILRAQVTLPYTTNIPRDVAMNVFHFLVPDGSGPADYEAITDALEGFYNGTHDGATLAVGSYIGAVVSRATNACTTIISNVDDGPQLPLYDAAFTLVDPTG